MQTVLTIDDNLFQEASSLVSIQNPNSLIEIALKELIKHHKLMKKPDVRELVGEVEISPEYDYKAMRVGD